MCHVGPLGRPAASKSSMHISRQLRLFWKSRGRKMEGRRGGEEELDEEKGNVDKKLSERDCC